MTEMQEINLVEEEDTFFETTKHKPINRRLVLLFLLPSFIFLILWLAESQFSHGVLRMRFRDEPCHRGIISNRCAKGFYCRYGTCQLPTVDPCPPVNQTYIDNRTVIHRPRQVTYFDFNEMPNHWLEPKIGVYKNILRIGYGACKDLCSKDKKCKALVYSGYLCAFMDDYTFPFKWNKTWNAAIKVL